jgi:hypothetical protein
MHIHQLQIEIMAKNKYSIYPAENLDVFVQDQRESVVPKASMSFAVNPLRQ